MVKQKRYKYIGHLVSQLKNIERHIQYFLKGNEISLRLMIIKISRKCELLSQCV